MSTIENRFDFLFLFDCQDGNPNGDPDSDNSPRFDPETHQGLVSDVCLKRKVRDYVHYLSPSNGSADGKGYEIYVMCGHTLESRQRRPFECPTLKDKIEPKGKATKTQDIDEAREWMCRHFFDVRAFGAVMNTTEFNCGQVRGPMQLTFARSVDPILSTYQTVFRQAYTGEKDIKPGGNGTFGHKYTIPYGLYVAHGYVNPFFADKTGFDRADLGLVRKALVSLFDMDRSSARGTMNVCGLPIFKHELKLGNAPAQSLFESIEIRKKTGVETPRSISDYEIVYPASLPPGVTLINGMHENFY